MDPVFRSTRTVTTPSPALSVAVLFEREGFNHAKNVEESDGHFQSAQAG